MRETNDASFLVRVARPVFICVIAECLAISAAVAQESPRQILENVLEVRTRLSQGHVELRARTSESGELGDAKERTWTIWWDGDRLRGDRHSGFEYPGEDREGGVEVSCFGCYFDNAHVFYSNRLVDGAPFALTITDTKDVDPRTYYVPDPRWVTYIPLDCITSGSMHVESFLTPPMEVVFDPVATEEVAGESCWRVRYVAGGVTAVTYWITKDQSNVKRSEMQFELGGKEIVDRVEVSGWHAADGDARIATDYMYRRTQDGDRTIRAEDGSFTVVSLNKPIDPVVFSLGGIAALKPGAPVQWAMDHDRPSPTADLIWDGERIVPLGDSFAGKERAVARSSRTFWVVFLTGAAIACVVAGYLMLRRRHGSDGRAD